MHLLNYPAAWYLNHGLVTERVARSAHPFIAPSQLYRTQDGWIFVMAQTQRFWEMLCEKLGRADLKATYPDFAARREHRDALTKILDAEFGKRTTAQWLDALRGTIPCGPVYDMAQALENPYFLERGGVQVFDHPDQPGLKLVASPFRIGEPLPAKPAPKLGEHTDALLEELGYGAADIARLKADKAV
jgi:crotonobetainyl-CoA:carnitine CoA-transferase CaiB-like acyl-CoA transferase